MTNIFIRNFSRYHNAVEGEAVMRMRFLVLLVLFCLMFMSPIAASFPAVYHECQHVSLGFFSSALVQAIIVHPNDPGSGGGGTGVIT